METNPQAELGVAFARPELLDNTLSTKVTLADLIRVWNERGAALPVAIVVSIFDDLLLSPTVGSARGHRPSLQDVCIDSTGFAHLGEGAVINDVADVAPLFARALAAGNEQSDVPSAALPLLFRLESQVPVEQPVDAEQLRSWIRDALGSPAPRDEVVACVDATSDLPMPSPSDFPIDVVSSMVLGDHLHSELVTELPSPAAVFEDTSEVAADEPLPYPALVDDSELATARPVAAIDLHEPSDLPDLPVALPVRPPAPPAPAAELRANEAPTELQRPVVRREPLKPDRPVAVPVAPAARTSARARLDGPDSLLLPAERSSWLPWLVLVGVVAAVIYFYVLN